MNNFKITLFKYMKQKKHKTLFKVDGKKQL